MAIFVVGAPSSGCAMVAEVLDELGVKFETPSDLLASLRWNGMGNNRLTAINQTIAAANGLTDRTLPAISLLKNAEGSLAYIEAVEAFAASMDESAELWGAVDPSLAFHLPVWRKAAPGSSVIICVHRPDVVSALLAEDEISPAYAAALWELYTLAAVRNSRGMPRFIIAYEQLLAEPAATVQKMISSIPELADAGFSEERIREAAARVVDDSDDVTEAHIDVVSPTQLDLYERLASGKLTLSRRSKLRTASEELILTAAREENARAACERLSVERLAEREAANQARLEHSQLLTRAIDILASVNDGDRPTVSPKALIDGLLAVAQRSAAPPPGYVHTDAVAEIAAMKDERIEWHKSQLAGATKRTDELLDELQAMRLRMTGSEGQGKFKQVSSAHEGTLADAASLHHQLDKEREHIGHHNGNRESVTQVLTVATAQSPAKQPVPKEAVTPMGAETTPHYPMLPRKSASATTPVSSASKNRQVTNGSARAHGVANGHSNTAPLKAIPVDQIRPQLVTVSNLLEDIDQLLIPKFGGRFWIPVRRIRVKLVQLREIVNRQVEHTRKL